MREKIKEEKRQRDVASAQNLLLDEGTNKEEWITLLDLDKVEHKKIVSPNCKKGELWTTNTEIMNVGGFMIGFVPVAIPVMVWSEVGLDQIVKVIPISLDTEFSMWPESILVSIKNFLLVEIFNERPMLIYNLGQCFGHISSGDLSRAELARDEFISNNGNSLDENYLQWKKVEFKLAEYLTLPVNLSL